MGKYTKKSPKREENYYESFKINIYYTKIRSDMCYFVTVTDWLQLLLQIDNHKEGGNPAEDAELDEMIFHETFCGRAAEAEDDHVLKIA